MIHRTQLEYATEKGPMRAYLAQPENGGPGVLVLHAWWGLNPFFERLCDRLAEQGFTAFAPDLNAGEVAQTVDEAKALMEKRDWAWTEGAAFGAADHLRSLPGVQPGPLGVIGFSMGAAWALELSVKRPQDFGAAVLFYGSNSADFSQSRAAYLGHFAEVDEWEPLDGIRQMESDLRAAGREVTFHLYPGTGHWFFEDDRPADYNAEAAALAWERTLEFLKEKLAA